MELIILGSGSAFPARAPMARNPAGYAVRLGRRVVLLDLGFGNLRQLLRAGLDPADVTDVFFSHRHPDHVGDLAALLFMLRCDAKPRAGRLRLWGPSGFKAHVARLRLAHAPWLEPRGYRLAVGEWPRRRALSLEGLVVSTLDVPHDTPSRAIKIHYKGRTMVYSGDTGFCPGLVDFAGGCDLFLLECTMPESAGYPWHLTPRVALATLEASGCRRGVLTHLSPRTRALLSRRRLPRGVVLADDLRRFVV